MEEDQMTRRNLVATTIPALAATAVSPSVASPAASHSGLPVTLIRRVEADGVNVFYREAGPADAPVILLLHGFRQAPSNTGS